MKICIVVDNLNESAGWGRLARSLEGGLIKAGHEVGFVTNGARLLEEGTALQVPMRNLSLKRLHEFIQGVLAMRAFFVQYDRVLCFDVNPYGIICSFALFFSRTPLVLYCLGSYSLLGDNVLRNLLMRYAFKKANKVVVVGEFVKGEIRKSGLSLESALILPVGVDPRFFYKTDIPSKLIQSPYIIGVGGLKHRKGFHLAIEAFAKISGEFPDLSYAIVGNSDVDGYADSLRKRVSELNLTKRILFLDRVSDADLRSLYSFAEFFVLTPITDARALEGFGMVYLEAACCGKAAIGTINSGAAEAIINNETGILVPPIPEEISEAMRKMFKDLNYTQTLATNAKKRSQEFEWDRVTRKLISILSPE
jgi:phosphatidylinositol alpha-1,6-mannosyltransferase